MMALGLGGSALSLIADQFKEQPQGYNDPYKGQRMENIKDLMSGRQGQQIANVASADAGRMANLAFEGFKNDPSLAGNAAARMGAYNATQRTAQDAVVKAQVQGSQIDMENKARANDMLAQERQFDYANYLQKQQANPSFGEQLLQSTISGVAGTVAGGLGQYANKELFGITPPATAGAPAVAPAAGAPAVAPPAMPPPGGTALPDLGMGVQQTMPQGFDWQSIMRMMSF